MVNGTEQGRIGPLTLPCLLQAICAKKQTGILTLRDDEILKTLYLNSGQVVFAASNDPDDRLGQLFLRRAMIPLKTLEEAAALSSQQGKRIGTILVQMKAIRPQDLVWGVTEQVKSMVIGLFQWTRGEYSLTRGTLPSEEVITLRMSTGDLVMSGIKSIEAWSRIEAAVGGPQTRYQPSPRLEEMARQMSLSLDEWTLLSRFESGAALGQICGESSLGDFAICRLIWAFTVVGLLLKEEAAGVGGMA